MALTTRKTVLITVKTYPNPSGKYEETVCTAGLDMDTGQFIRLYPVRYRDLDYNQAFAKYDLIEMDVFHKSNDLRGDTYTPVEGTFAQVGHVGTGSKRHPDWAERNGMLLSKVSTLEELVRRAERREGSIGLVRAHGQGKFTVEADDEDWTPAQKLKMTKECLFGRSRTRLEKVPFKFHYSFRCCEGCPGHKLQVLDWEAYALYRKMKSKYGSDQAVQHVLNKHNVEFATTKKNLHLYVGTVHNRPSQFSIIGFYYPPAPSV